MSPGPSSPESSKSNTTFFTLKSACIYLYFTKISFLFGTRKGLRHEIRIGQKVVWSASGPAGIQHFFKPLVLFCIALISS
jgi:hypothetical protein